MEIKINKELTLVESIQFQLRLLFLRTEPKLTDRQLLFLTYLYLYPKDYTERLINEGILISRPSINYQKTLLSHCKILVRTENGRTENPGRPSGTFKLNPSIIQWLSNKDTSWKFNIKIKDEPQETN